MGLAPIYATFDADLTNPAAASRASVTSKEPRLTIHKNGYDFAVDAHARTRQVSGEVQFQPQPRSRTAQANTGKPDRRGTDDGGHYIAARFNGPRDWFNHFAQDANFNRGAYRTLEDQWAKAVRSGHPRIPDQVLDSGALPMKILEAKINRWIESKGGKAPAQPTKPERG